MKHSFIKLAVLALASVVAAAAHADEIVQNTGGTGNTVLTADAGESSQTTPDFLYYNLPFNFYSNYPASTASAAGTAFPLGLPYTGIPLRLEVTTPGSLTEAASTTATSTAVFAPVGMSANFPLNGTRIGLPLPEPSSQTALYVLSGAVGLGFVVLRRRRTVA